MWSITSGLLAATLSVFLLSLALTGLLRRLAPRLGLMAEPVARSAHTRLTPSGGGLSIVLAFIACITALRLSGLLPADPFMALTAAVFIAAVGLWDDIRHLPAGLRITLHLAAALWAVGWLGAMPALNLGGYLLESIWLLAPLTVVSLVWLLNLYNFMDGIDGLAAAEALFVILLSLFLVSDTLSVMDGDAGFLVWLWAVLAAATAGFLCWNWPPAKIFMGDAGSGLLGLGLGLLALISIQQELMTLWTWLLMLGVFVVDASVTLLRRMFSGQRWIESHAVHAYQYAARRYGSHAKVTAAVTLINILWLAPLAWLSLRRPEAGMYLCVLGLAPLIILAFRLRAGVSLPPASATGGR